MSEQLNISELDKNEEEYNFTRIKTMFYPLLQNTFKISLKNIPSWEELLSTTEEIKGDQIVISEYDRNSYFQIPENMNSTTGLAFLCFLILKKGKSPNTRKMYLKYYRQRNVRKEHLDKRLFLLTKIQSDMFNHISFLKYKEMVTFAKGMASFLYFEKLHPNKKDKNLADYPSYAFFNNLLNPEKPKLGFGIPETIRTKKGEEISINDLPVLGFQGSDNVNDYFDFKKPKGINEDGDVEYEPTEKVKNSNDLMKKVLNMGRGIDAFFKTNGYNIISLYHKVGEEDQRRLLSGELLYENGNLIKAKYPKLTKGKNILLMFGPIKSSVRSVEKVNSVFNKDISYLSDIIRATFVCESSSQLKEFNKLFYKGMVKMGCELSIRPRDRFTNPLSVGYGDILTVWLLPNDFACEIQISLIDMIIAKSEAHTYYEIERSLNAIMDRPLTPEERDTLIEVQEKQKLIYTNARIKSGLKSVVGIKNKLASVEITYYDFNGMPGWKIGKDCYFIDFSNKERIVDVDTKYSFDHEAMQISRVQFEDLMKEFKEVIRIKS
jgi:hypothetical protein